MRFVLLIVGYALRLALIGLLVGLILLLAGCSSDGGGAPADPEHGWADGSYTVAVGGQVIPLRVAGDRLFIGSVDSRAGWHRFRPTRYGVRGTWYLGQRDGVRVGIQQGYRVVILAPHAYWIREARPVATSEVG